MIKKMYNANFEIETEHLNQTLKEVKDVAYYQEVKGINKYGKPLDPYDNYDWLDMEFEELIDALKYNRAEKKKRKLAIERIRTITERCDYEVKQEINHWLDFWEGK